MVVVLGLLVPDRFIDLLSCYGPENFVSGGEQLTNDYINLPGLTLFYQWSIGLGSISPFSNITTYIVRPRYRKLSVLHFQCRKESLSKRREIRIHKYLMVR